jgi:hypothetical protein
VKAIETLRKFRKDYVVAACENCQDVFEACLDFYPGFHTADWKGKTIGQFIEEVNHRNAVPKAQIGTFKNGLDLSGIRL